MLFRPLINVTQQNRQNVFAMMAAMMIVASFVVLATTAFVQNNELYEGDDFLEIEGWVALSISITFFRMLSITIPRLEGSTLFLCVADLGGGILAPPQISAQDLFLII